MFHSKMLGSNRAFSFKARMVLSVAGLVGGAFGSSVAVAQIALPEVVETTQLATDAFSTGTLDATTGALASSLWDGSDGQTLEYLLAELPTRPATPSLGDALRRLLLSSGSGPATAGPSLGGKKLLALVRGGFADEARTVSSLSTASRGDPWTEQADAIGDLLNDDIAGACQRNAGLSSGRDEAFWVRLRVLCYAEAGETDAADLTFGVLRDQGMLSAEDQQYLTAAVTGVLPKTTLDVQNALQMAIARKLGVALSPFQLRNADAGVLAAIAKDAALDPAVRISSAEQAIGMGVMPVSVLSTILQNVSFDVTELSSIAATAEQRAGDPVIDALLFHSVAAMSAPEFLRDKAQRISLALSLADSFHRAYALSLLYADEISALEGAIVSPEEASRFAVARMAIGDSVGAGKWLSAMVGVNGGISALPEAQAMTFIERVNLLAVLDPQTAAQIARVAGVAMLGENQIYPTTSGHSDSALMAHIVEAAFDAALEGKKGQAGLAALAASTGSDSGGEVESVVVSQSLRAAGLSQLQRRYAFEAAWRSMFDEAEPATTGSMDEPVDNPGGLMPRLKPSRQ